MNKMKKCLIVVGDILDPTSMYENGYKFLSRCGMHFVSLSKVLYSIYCSNTLNKSPTHDEVASLTQCNESLVPDGEQNIGNTNKVITKYAINEGLKHYIEFIANNSRNFQVENITSDTIHPNYGNEFCKVLPYDCNSVPVGEYINKTLSILNNLDHSGATCSNRTSMPLQADLWDYDARSYLIAGVAMVAATGIGVYAGYRYWSYKSAQEDVFFYQQHLNRMDNLQAQRPQTQRIMESIAPKYLKIDVCEAEINNKNFATNKFYPPISGGTTSEARECYEFAAAAIGNSVSDRGIRNYISNHQMLEAETNDKNLTAKELYSPAYSSMHRYYEIRAELVDNSVVDQDINNTNDGQPNAIYMEAYDTACITNHEENAYMLPVDKN